LAAAALVVPWPSIAAPSRIRRSERHPTWGATQTLSSKVHASPLKQHFARQEGARLGRSLQWLPAAAYFAGSIPLAIVLAMTVFIALLRAVNVGGTGMLPMKELKLACEAAGLQQVSTHLASGNVLCRSDRTAEEVKDLVAGVLRGRFGLARNHTLIRRPSDLAEVIAGNPFADAAAARPNRLMVHYLDGLPQPGAAEVLAAFTGPERLHLNGSHLCVDYTIGQARSKLTPTFLNKALGVATTARNWNTTNKLLDLARVLERSAA
jgi:uncharacterized protein (DUF1697 family)